MAFVVQFFMAMASVSVVQGGLCTANASRLTDQTKIFNSLSTNEEGWLNIVYRHNGTACGGLPTSRRHDKTTHIECCDMTWAGQGKLNY
ncbi:hypothetical protein KDM41_03110 [bacterium]|nr:hypothetical protein [bacterium]